jgi:hypothetical protein
MRDDVKPYLNVKWLDEDAPALYDWYDEYPYDLEMWRTLCRDVRGRSSTWRAGRAGWPSSWRVRGIVSSASTCRRR